MKIAFLTSAHSPLDDRIFHHQGEWLANKGHHILIVSSTYFLEQSRGLIAINSFDGNRLSKKNKVAQFVKRVAAFTPDTIICSEPLAIYAAQNYRAQHPQIKIVSDVTEWYPSKKQLDYFPRTTQWLHFIKLASFNIYTSTLVDGYIFGEWYKSIPFRKLYPKRPYIFQSYYPHLKLFNPAPAQFYTNTIRLCYSGKLTKEKGFDRFISVAKTLAEKWPNLQVSIKIIGWYPNTNEEAFFEQRLNSLPKNTTVRSYSNQPLEKYITLISDTDIFFDLRDNDWENQRCLPIKLFYYTALGRPVIFSDLKAIRKEVEIEKFGHLVRPDDSQKCLEIIEAYLRDINLYQNHCTNARHLAEEKYNWDVAVEGFEAFLKCL